jgi:transcriptional regulator with XRE-family HTH domain
MYDPPTALHHAYMAKRVTSRPRKPQWRKTFIREWREHRQLTLEQLAERVGTTHATLSRVERGLIPYSQAMLEALAEALQTEPASLLIRNPTDPEGIWSVWDQAKPGQKQTIVEIAKTVLKTGT